MLNLNHVFAFIIYIIYIINRGKEREKGIIYALL